MNHAAASFRIPRRSLLVRSCSGFIGLIMVSGCATDPYVTLSEQQPINTHLSYDQGIAYANSARLDYQKALSKQTKDQNSLSNALLVLGGAGVGMAFGGAHRSALGYTALIGGTAYTLGTWNTSQPRENAYLEGMKAMDCVMIAAEPLAVSNEAKTRLSGDIQRLADSIAAVNTSIAAVEVEAERLPKKQSKDARRAKAAINIVRSIVNTANETQAAALQVEKARDNAGTSIFNTVNSVNTLINKAIHDTIPDLSLLPSVIKGLAATSDIFVPGAGLADSLAKISTGKPAPAGVTADRQLKEFAQSPKLAAATQADNLDSLIADMKTKAATLTSLVQQIKLQVESGNTTQAVEKMRGCGITVDLDIHIEPGQLTFVEKQSSTKYLIVSGGKKPYIASVLDKSSPVTANSPFPVGDSKVEVVASEKTKAGDSYTVYIQDATGKTKTIAVTIQPSTP